MKLCGMLLLIWAGTLGGCAAARRLDGNARRIRVLRQLITMMMTELRSNLPLIADLLRTLAAQPAFRSLGFLQDAAAHAAEFPQCWQRALALDETLSPEETAVLETVGQTLGSMALEGQLSALELCLERLAVLQEDAALRARSKGRLYRSLGLLGAVFLAILLI